MTECDCLKLAEIPHTTRLYSAFVEEFSKVKEFYAHPPNLAGVRAAAKAASIGEGTRRSACAILRDQNRALGNDESAERNIARLENGAAAIVTGQQTGLFTGPAYSLYKALSALHWAGVLTRAGVDAVPIFWTATEDHDLAEVNQAHWLGRDGLARFELPVREDAAGRSVGRIRLGDQIEAMVDHAAQLLEGPSATAVAGMLRETYRPSETFGSAFGKLMAGLFAGRGLILLDPLDQRWHELAKPIYRRAIEGCGAITHELLDRNKLLVKRGFHAQVKVTQQSTLIFYEVEGIRQAVRRRGGEFAAGARKMNEAELLRDIEERPEMITASVLLRPVVQDFILPTAAYVGGPGEIAYFAQGSVVYREMGIRMPAIVPRENFTLVESGPARLLAKYGLDIPDVLRGRQQLRRKMEAGAVSKGLSAKFSRDEKTLRRLLEAYRRPLTKVDASLRGALENAERKMNYQLGKLRERAGRAENFRSGVLDRHELQIVSALFPHRELQERLLSLLPFLAREGAGLLDGLLGAMAKPCVGHRVMKL